MVDVEEVTTSFVRNVAIATGFSGLGCNEFAQEEQDRANILEGAANEAGVAERVS